MSTTCLTDRTAFIQPAPQHDPRRERLRLRCPACAYPLGPLISSTGVQTAKCPRCQGELRKAQGIWKCLTPEREKRFRQFVLDYESVRAREGRASLSSLYYLSLPYKDVSGRNSWQWKIRSRSFRYLEEKILPALKQGRPDGLDILDVGAGNCWLSYRLALRGHRPVALDLLTNEWDGLGAARHYFTFLSEPFPRFQAEMDRLPFEDAQFDLIVFNASFHYSEDYEHTLKEALRCARKSGAVAIVDSPFYSREESGAQMVEERRAAFEKLYGTRSDSVRSQEFLTPAILEGLGKQLGVQWQVREPRYGLGWALRPWRARFAGRREPARFFLLVGTASSS